MMNDKWEEGYQARQEGKDQDSNPYADQGEFGADFMDWQTGWECADADHEQ